MNFILRSWFGEEEYHDAWHKQLRTTGFYIRFWGRLVIAAAGLCFFAWQQISEPQQWWGSDRFATIVLVITTTQAAGPFFYLLFKVTRRVFLTEPYLERLEEGRFYISVKSALCVLLMTILSILAADGLLGERWYVKPLVFLLTVPVISYWIIFPMLNRFAMRGSGSLKARH